VRHSPKLEQNLQPFGRRESLVIGSRGRFGLAESSKLGDHRFHGPILSPKALSRKGASAKQQKACSTDLPFNRKHRGALRMIVIMINLILLE
jgi:hypothetical protein